MTLDLDNPGTSGPPQGVHRVDDSQRGVTAAVSRQLFPNELHSVSERNLAITAGLGNLLAAPFGGYLMCHGQDLFLVLLMAAIGVALNPAAAFAVGLPTAYAFQRGSQRLAILAQTLTDYDLFGPMAAVWAD